jgi:hypothetical protein
VPSRVIANSVCTEDCYGEGLVSLILAVILVAICGSLVFSAYTIFLIALGNKQSYPPPRASLHHHILTALERYSDLFCFANYCSTELTIFTRSHRRKEERIEPNFRTKFSALASLTSFQGFHLTYPFVRLFYRNHQVCSAAASISQGHRGPTPRFWKG